MMSTAAPGPDEPATGTTERSSYSWLDKWSKLIVSIGGALGVLWVGVMLWNPIGDVDVTVRIVREIPVSLPPDVATDRLRLVHDDQNITRAVIVGVEVMNSGSKTIGGRGEKWLLNLRNPARAKVVALGPPRPVPSNRSVSVTAGPDPSVVSLDFEMLNVGDTVALDVMLVDPKEDGGLPVVAEMNFPGLSHLVTGRRNRRERLRDAFVPPVGVVTACALAVLLVRERRQLVRARLPLGDVHKFPQGVITVLMGATILTAGITWVIAWFAERVLVR